MTPEATQARAAVTRLERELKAAQNHLAGLERRCSHQWSDAKYTPDVREGYRDPGDPPGTMGIDRRLPTYVSRQETPKWTRKCSTCGTTETTTRTTEKVTASPRF